MDNDKGIFGSDMFLADVHKHEQTISFCGMDAHHAHFAMTIFLGKMCCLDRLEILDELPQTLLDQFGGGIARY